MTATLEKKNTQIESMDDAKEFTELLKDLTQEEKKNIKWFLLGIQTMKDWQKTA